MPSWSFHNPSQELPLSLDEVAQKIKQFIREDTESSYKLTIGTDSEIRHGKSEESILELISAIVIYRKGYGGRYFWTKKKMKSFKTLREKIYQEVMLSLELAHAFVPSLRENLNEHSNLYDLEIHIDVGESGATRTMIREVVGLVTGSGFIAKTKPYSYAASNIADRYA